MIKKCILPQVFILTFRGVQKVFFFQIPSNIHCENFKNKLLIVYSQA